MGRAIVMHIDEAPWLRGGPQGKGDFPSGGGQMIGDKEKGPWVHIEWLPPGLVVRPHSHSHDEIIYVVEGDFTAGAKRCGPGTVVYVEKDTQYGFTVGPKGVRFLNIRTGLATMTMDGKAWNPYQEAGR